MGAQRTISFRLDDDKIAALDDLAENADRDRSYLLNEAVANYLELQTYQTKLVKEGLAAVKAGRTIGTMEVRKRIAKLAHGSRSK
jgi:predicted transcriptional regulator